MTTDRIGLHLVLLPLYIIISNIINWCNFICITYLTLPFNQQQSSKFTCTLLFNLSIPKYYLKLQLTKLGFNDDCHIVTHTLHSDVDCTVDVEISVTNLSSLNFNHKCVCNADFDRVVW